MGGYVWPETLSSWQCVSVAEESPRYLRCWKFCNFDEIFPTLAAGRWPQREAGGGNVLIAGFVLNIGLSSNNQMSYIHTLSPFESNHNLCQNLTSTCIQIASWITIGTKTVLTSHIDYFHPLRMTRLWSFSIILPSAHFDKRFKASSRDPTPPNKTIKLCCSLHRCYTLLA